MLQRARRRWGDPVARLEKLADVVPASVRRRIVIGAYRVCSADGELHREESRLLDRVGEALNLSPQEVRMALREAKAVRSSVRRVLVTLPKGGS
ncbi:MAG: TerB family tellurite resistance protein [Gemmatimonadota bacterium]